MPTRSIRSCGVYLAVLALALVAAAGAPLAAQEAEPAPALGQATAPTEELILGPGDVLKIDVFGLEELDRRVRVLRDGTISLPLLGSLKLAGLTLQEAEQSIASLLEEQRLVVEPQVSIFVEELVSRGVTIQGAVHSPGVYQMIGNKTLLEMLGEAGGLLQRDHERAGQTIRVLRTGAGGARQGFEVDAERLVRQGDLALDMPLEPGDVVLVPHASKLRVYVTGAVQRPGPVEFLTSEGITVLQAITSAGGPTERSNLKKVHVLRRLEDGSQERIRVNIKRIQRGKEEDLVLQKNDTVVVGEWFF